MIPFFGQMPLGGVAGPAGYDTVTQVIKNTGSFSSATGTLNAVAGALIPIGFTIRANSGGTVDPSLWTVTLGGSPATLAARSANTTTVQPQAAIFLVTAPASGNLTLDVTTNHSVRSMFAAASVITGLGGSPLVLGSGGESLGTDLSALSLPGNLATQAGDIVWGCLSVLSPTATGLACAGADSLPLTMPTGADGSKDHLTGFAVKRAIDAAPTTFNWSWSPASRPAGAFVQLR